MESHEVEEIKRHFDVIAESLRGDIKAIAEGHSLLNEKLDILREENAGEHKELHKEIVSVREDLNTLREENAKEHKEILSELKLSYAELDHRVSTLENK